LRNTLWLDLLHPFTTVKNLYLSKNSAPRIAAALKVLVGDRTTEVLPTLQNIYLEELEPSGAVQVGVWAVRRHTTGHQSPNSSFSLGQLEGGQDSELLVDDTVMLLSH
jgi:hypothetical protein